MDPPQDPLTQNLLTAHRRAHHRILAPAILFREILPNVMPSPDRVLTLEMGIALVVEAILSLVGLSVSSDTPTWGGMIAEGRQIVHEAWWVLAAH